MVAARKIDTSKPYFDPRCEIKIPKAKLDQLRASTYLSRDIKNLFPGARHELISTNDEVLDPYLGKCHQRIGYFCLSSGQPIVFTIAFISVSRIKPELIEDSRNELKPFGDLLRDYYPYSEITSENIPPPTELADIYNCPINLPQCFVPATTKKQVMRRERFIFVDGNKIARVVEFI